MNTKVVWLYRLSQTREQMAKYNTNVSLLGDTIKIFYATGACIIQVRKARMNTARRLLLTFDCSVLLDFHNCAHLAVGLESIDESRVAQTVSHQCAGHRLGERERTWTARIAELISLIGEEATAKSKHLSTNISFNLKSFYYIYLNAQKLTELLAHKGDFANYG